MKPTEKKILRKCLELQQLNAESKPEPWRTWSLDNWHEIQEHGPTYRISEWFGELPERDRVHYRRTIKALEKQGLLKTWRRWGDRMTNVKLTEAGETIAAKSS